MDLLNSSSSFPLQADRSAVTQMENPAESWVLQVHLRFSPAIFSFIVFSLAAGALSSDPRPEDCEPRHCGNGLNISYPFWIRGLQHSYCGYPGYDITCKGDAPVADDGVETYQVRDIFYDNMSAIIIAELPENSCPYPLHNLSFTRTLFNVSSVNRELLFHLNCTESLPAGSRAIECAENRGKGKVSWVAEGPVPENQNVSPSCDSVVVWPFLAYGAVDNNRSYESLLDNGFLLEWKAPNCSRCSYSGGRCGYKQTSNEFMCICRDRVHRVSCGNGSGSRRIRKIAIGVGAGGAGFLLASFLCLLLYRRKKMRARTGSSTLLFRTASLEPSSQKDPETGSTHYPTHLFRYDELSEATDGFSDANELGDGGFGTVYKGKLRDGRIVAVKRLYENNYKRVEQFLNEVAILNRLQHPNLVTLYGCTSRHSRELLLVYEYVPNGTVADHLHGHRASEGALTWPIRLSIAIETSTALAYLHKVEPQIIHRDVKTNNILLHNNFHVKVADFGLSRLFPMDATHVSTAPQGTPGYVDPEYHQCYQLTDKSDVYSFGVVLVELISSKPAVDITRHRHEINLASMAISKIQNGALHELVDPTLDFETDSVARRMIKLVAELAFRCLQAEKEMRPSMEDVLEVLQGIRDCQDQAERSGRMDHGVTDDMSLLKDNAPVSPDSVMDKWASRKTTPNTSA